MSTTDITVHGFCFLIEGTGFAGQDASAMDDFDTIAASLQAVLAALPVGAVARLHAGAILTDDGATDEAAFTELDRMLRDVTRPVLAIWAHPDEAFTSISALS